MSNLYYTPPSNESFEEVKEASMKLWHIVDTDNDAYGYATEKVNRIKDIKNVGDNFMYMVAMFDQDNQQLLSEMLSQQARADIRLRMVDGGTPEQYIVF